MTDLPVTAKGYMSGGEVTFDGSFVTIRRKGLAARASYGKGDTRLPISQISEVKFKAAGWLVNGFILFVTAGTTLPDYKAGEQMKKLAHLPNAVIFTNKGQTELEALREAVESAIAHGMSRSS